MMTGPAPAKGYEKHAWILLFAIGLFHLLGAVTHVAGVGSEELVAGAPGAESLVRFVDRELGIALVGFSVLTLVIARVSYRKGERWAWYALWTVPGFILGQDIANNLSVGLVIVGFAGLLLAIGLLIVSLLGLFLPYRKFFPRK